MEIGPVELNVSAGNLKPAEPLLVKLPEPLIVPVNVPFVA